MATRYYTEEAYEQIHNTIETIQTSDLDPVVDFFQDLLSRIIQRLKQYTVDDYQQNIQSWYTMVLDSHNTTMTHVDSIFNAVESVDFEYRDIMLNAYNSIVSFRNTVNGLRDIISGKVSLAEGTAAAERFLADGKSALYTSYDAILTKMESQVLGESSLALLKDALKYGAGYVKMLLAFKPPAFTLNPSKAAIATKKFTDTCFAIWGDLLAMGLILGGAVEGCVGARTGMTYQEYLDLRFEHLSAAKKCNDVNSTTDLLKVLAGELTEDLAEYPHDSPFYPVMKTIADSTQDAYVYSKGLDALADTVDLCNGISDSLGEMDAWINGKDYTLEEYLKKFQTSDFHEIQLAQGKNGLIITETIPPSKIVSKIISDRTGIPLTNWSDPDKAIGNVYELSSTLLSYGEALNPTLASFASECSDISDVAIGKIKEVGTTEDVIDLIQDLNDEIQILDSSDPGYPKSYMQYDRDLHTWTKIVPASAGGR